MDDIHPDQALTSISDYLEQTGLKRPTLYSRMNALSIEPVKVGRNSFLSEEQISHLQDLHEHLGRGGSVADFGVDGVIDAPTSSTLAKSTKTAMAPSRSMEGLLLIAETLAEATRPDVGQVFLNRLRVLQEASENGWEFSTNDLAELLQLGRQAITKHQVFERHGFTFIRSQKKGRSFNWKVTKDD